MIRNCLNYGIKGLGLSIPYFLINELATGLLYRRVGCEQFFLSNTFSMITMLTALRLYNFKRNPNLSLTISKIEPALLIWVFGNSLDITLLLFRSSIFDRSPIDEEFGNRFARNLNKLRFGLGEVNINSSQEEYERLKSTVAKEKTEVDETIEILKQIKREMVDKKVKEESDN